MKVLVAGGTGFVGREIVSACLKRGFRVVTLSRSKFPCLDPNHKHIVCDWGGAYKNLELTKFAPDAIINAVGDLHPRKSIGQETDLIVTNLLPYFRLLDEHKKISLKRTIFISSAGALYKSSTNSVVKTSADTAYFSLKLAAETLLTTWSKTHRIDAISVRLSNPVGYNEKLDFGVVNHFSRTIVLNKTPEYVGDYTTLKDYIDVRDAGDAVAFLLDQSVVLPGHRIMDLGSGFSLDAPGIHKALIEMYKGGKITSAFYAVSKFNNPIQQLGWTPSYSIFSTFSDILSNATQKISPDE